MGRLYFFVVIGLVTLGFVAYVRISEVYNPTQEVVEAKLIKHYPMFTTPEGLDCIGYTTGGLSCNWEKFNKGIKIESNNQ